MWFRACAAGNMSLVKWLWDYHRSECDVNADRDGIPGSMKSVLAETIYGGRGPNDPKRTGNFREVAVFLIENGADPTRFNNEVLLVCKKGSIPMFDGEKMFSSDKPKQGHDKVVWKLIRDQRVIERVFELKQEQFYYLFPGVEEMFIF